MADRLDRFTKQARQVLTLAREAALRLNHEHIRPEHLLLGIASEQTCTALQILETLGVDADQIVRTVEATVERGERAPAHKPMLAEATKRVIELAVQEALAMGGGEIGSEHLLLGMVQPPGTVVAGLLHETGVTAEQMRTQVARVR